jgi:Ser/Thr protein kinase RdoA (MazF antagonist)
VSGVNLMPFSEIVNEVPEQAKLLYDISSLSKSTLLSFNKNVEFLIEDKKSGFYTLLRVSRPGHHTKEELLSEIRWIRELEKRDFPFMLEEVIPGIDDNFVQQIRLSNGDICYCIMYAYLRGRPLEGLDSVELNAYFVKLGEITALLHQNAIQWDGTQTLSRKVIDFEALIGTHAQFGLWRHANGSSKDGVPISNDLCLLFDRAADIIKQRLGHFGMSAARFGLIHADLTTSNVLLYKNRLALTHFEDCGFGWFLYDFASSVSFIDDDTLLPKLSAAWLEGYRRQRNISNEESSEMPTFVLLRRLNLLCRLVNGLDSATPFEYGKNFVRKTAMLAEKFLADN